MANLNILQILKMLRGNNPQQIAEQLVRQNLPLNPQFTSLIQMGKNGDTKGIEEFAQNFCSQRGVTPDDFKSFMSFINGH